MQSLVRLYEQVRERLATRLAWQMASVGGVCLVGVLGSLQFATAFLMGHLFEQRWRVHSGQQVELAASLLDYGLAVGDDLLIVTVLSRLSASPEVTDAVVLDRTGQVIAHPQVTERGKRLQDPLSQRCAGATRLMFLSDEGGWYLPSYQDVVAPLSHVPPSGGVLRVRYRDPRRSSLWRVVWGSFWTCSGVVWLVGVWGCYRGGELIAAPLRLALNGLPLPTSEVSPSSIPRFHQRNEVGDLLQRVVPIRQHLAVQEAHTKAIRALWEQRLTIFLQALGRQWLGGIILTDGAHRILFANDVAKELFCGGPLVQEGQHLFDVLSHGECLTLFKQSWQTPNQRFHAAFRGLPEPVTVLHLSDEHLFGAFLVMP